MALRRKGKDDQLRKKQAAQMFQSTTHKTQTAAATTTTATAQTPMAGSTYRKQTDAASNDKRANSTLGIAIKISDLIKIGELGRGATGPVLKAFFVPQLKIVALKTVRVYNKEERHQMVKELDAFNNLSQSPHIISLIGACFADGKVTMVLEYMNRGSLQQAVKEYGRFSESTVQSIAKDSLMALQHLHSLHRIHRDIKPANVLLSSNGKAKLADFGLLRELESTADMCSTFVGTMAWLSPERILGNSFAYPSDIYAFGMTMLYCAMGGLELPSDYWALLKILNQSDWRSSFKVDSKSFSSEFLDFISLCLKKEPADRGTATQLLQHPFILKQYTFDLPPYMSIVTPAERELQILADAFARHFAEDLIEKDSGRIAYIAHQLGWSPEVLAADFQRRLVSGLIDERTIKSITMHSDSSDENTDDKGYNSASLDTKVFQLNL